MLARLFYPVVDPTFNYRFCKGFYFRSDQEKLNGRVARLLVTPLLRALKKIFGRTHLPGISRQFQVSPWQGFLCVLML
ncbi:MAG: hypothetical protein U5L09_02465 [Bacteroidales bacterium]|nr:hypothetical protein [Bacteroidales bacterium]